MKDFLKRLQRRLLPWYNPEEMEEKQAKAHESHTEVKRFARDANKVILSYRQYGKIASTPRR
jgi:type I site-specific restriction-modification system R (restriction) subunit